MKENYKTIPISPAAECSTAYRGILPFPSGWRVRSSNDVWRTAKQSIRIQAHALFMILVAAQRIISAYWVIYTANISRKSSLRTSMKKQLLWQDEISDC